ncbi:MAG: hypothetical protein RBS39_08735 [Phycisphaerales bacterium]|jgi:hypothetical protein|nr:hypothetical protein [Phycisphaerales bacterium]
MLMIGTLHFEVTHICLGSLELEELLLGQRVIRGSFDPETGEASEPHSAWSLKSSVFFDEKGQSSIGHLSGVVLAGFGTIDDSRNFPLAKTCCVLNPCADYPLNTIDHPDLCFGQLRSGSLGEPARIEWVRGDGTPCDDASLCAARRWQSLKNLYQAGELELLREILRSDGVCDEPD